MDRETHFPGAPVSYRRCWRRDLLVLGLLAFGTIAVFGFTDLDLVAARYFHQPAGPEAWPAGRRTLWWVLHHSAPWVTAALVLTALAGIFVGTLRRGAVRLRLYGLFLLLSVAVGPGLVVNGILKDHWGRERPRSVAEFGGTAEYCASLLPCASHGKSFPCGHCSVGYLVGAGWFVWRRRRRLLGAASLGAGVLLGTLLGTGRMAAGGHWLSDIVWSGLIAFGVAWLLYYFVLGIPAREDAADGLLTSREESPRRRALLVVGYSVLGAAVVLGGILATPTYEQLHWRIDRIEPPTPPGIVELDLDRTDVQLTLSADSEPLVLLTGSIHGFGLPTNRVRWGWERVEWPAPRTRYWLRERGWFTELEGMLQVQVSATQLTRVVVRVREGDVMVRDETSGRTRDGSTKLPLLDITTGRGRVTAAGSSPADSDAREK